MAGDQSTQNPGESNPLLSSDALVALWSELPVENEFAEDIRKALRAYLRFHATEGREALIRRGAHAIAEANGGFGSWADTLRDAEAVVTALFGEAS